jgi:hypothetical protein
VGVIKGNVGSWPKMAALSEKINRYVRTDTPVRSVSRCVSRQHSVVGFSPSPSFLLCTLCACRCPRLWCSVSAPLSSLRCPLSLVLSVSPCPPSPVLSVSGALRLRSSLSRCSLSPVLSPSAQVFSVSGAFRRSVSDAVYCPPFATAVLATIIAVLGSVIRPLLDV